jgi:hypothetical protein
MGATGLEPVTPSMSRWPSARAPGWTILQSWATAGFLDPPGTWGGPAGVHGDVRQVCAHFVRCAWSVWAAQVRWADLPRETVATLSARWPIRDRRFRQVLGWSLDRLPPGGMSTTMSESCAGRPGAAVPIDSVAKLPLFDHPAHDHRP